MTVTSATVTGDRRERRHGTNVKYVIDKCRCTECRAAAAEYSRGLRRRHAYGRSNYVDAARARDHVRFLMAQEVGSPDGVGLKRIAAVSGVSTGTIWKLLYGDRKRFDGPSRRIHRETERKLLAVKSEHRAPGAHVGAAYTWEMIECMIGYGFTREKVSAALGNSGRGLKIGREKVRVSTERRVRHIHRLCFENAPGYRMHCRCGSQV